jgi:hypothetical protein
MARGKLALGMKDKNNESTDRSLHPSVLFLIRSYFDVSLIIEILKKIRSCRNYLYLFSFFAFKTQNS